MRVFAMVVAGLGGTIVMLATWLGLSRRRQERTGRQVRAQVVEIVVERLLNRGGSGDMYYPVFEFVAPDGRSVRHRSTFGNGTPTHSVGDEVVVWHDPADPERCDIVGEGRGFAPLIALVGLILLTVGASLFFFV